MEKKELHWPVLSRILTGTQGNVKGPQTHDANLHPAGPPPYIYGYVRVSYVERQTNSAKVQEDAIDKRAAQGDIPGTYVGCGMDYVSTQEKPFHLRNFGIWLLRNVRQGDSVIAVKFDRFGRTVGQMTEAVEQLYDRGAAVYILNFMGQALPVASTTGRFLVSIMGASARLENDLRIERIRDTLRYRKAHGMVYTHVVPFGMRRMDQGKIKMWVEDPDQIELLKMFKRMRDQGYSITAIGKWALENNLKDQNGHEWIQPIPAKPGCWTTNKLGKALKWIGEYLQNGGTLTIAPKNTTDSASESSQEAASASLPSPEARGVSF
jgi:DNA invertase Pin-like site-specific DNA recombinase